MSMEEFKWLLRGARLVGVGVAIASTGGAIAVPLIAQEIAENFVQTVAEEGLGEILGMSIKFLASEGGTFLVEGVAEAMTNEEVLTFVAQKLSLPLGLSMSALTAVGVGIGQVSSQKLKQIKGTELINDKADEAYLHAKKVVDEVPLSRARREKCDKVLAKLNQTRGASKAVGVRWLLSKNINEFLKDMSKLGGAFQDIKTTLLKLGIDITTVSPMFG